MSLTINFFRPVWQARLRFDMSSIAARTLASSNATLRMTRANESVRPHRRAPFYAVNEQRRVEIVRPAQLS
jgi:hypothetical protein